MFHKFLVSLLFLSIFLCLGNHQQAFAEETNEVLYSFTPVRSDPLYVTTTEFIPEIDDEVIIFFFKLSLTQTLVDELKGVTAVGGHPSVEFQTRRIFMTQGCGDAAFSAHFFVDIDHADGSRTAIRIEQAAESSEGLTGHVEKVERFSTPLADWVDLLQPGDALVVGGRAQGTVDAGRCSIDDEAAVFWTIEGSIEGDPDRPVIVGG